MDNKKLYECTLASRQLSMLALCSLASWSCVEEVVWKKLCVELGSTNTGWHISVENLLHTQKV